MMVADENSELSDDRGSSSIWKHLPDEFQYLQKWADKYGLRGLTVYFGKQPPLEKLASKEELVQLRTAYETIAKRGDGSRIVQWCLSDSAETPENEIKEEVRGLLLLFEQLADRGLVPFTDGQVRYVFPDPPPLDWSLLPPFLQAWVPWLKKFEMLRTEYEMYCYVDAANEEQLRELAALSDQMDRDGEALTTWCQENDNEGDPAENEAFQAGWLYVLADFAKSRMK